MQESLGVIDMTDEMNAGDGVERVSAIKQFDLKSYSGILAESNPTREDARGVMREHYEVREKLLQGVGDACNRFAKAQDFEFLQYMRNGIEFSKELDELAYRAFLIGRDVGFEIGKKAGESGSKSE